MISGRWALWTLCFSLLCQVSCSKGGADANSSGDEAVGESLAYAFGSIDGQLITAESNLGRVSVLLFVTTFDVASQAQARRLEDIFRTHVPRINAVAVVLEAPRYVDLARTFRDVLGLHYPVAIVDKQAISQHPVLAKVRRVPTWLFLDRRGRLNAVASGSLTPRQLEKAVNDAE